MLIAARGGAVLLILIGFTLAALSHPVFHSPSARSDDLIDGLLVSGIACTLLGILAFLLAIRSLDRRTKRLWLIPVLLVLTAVFGFLVFPFIHVPPLTVVERGGVVSQGALSVRTPTKLIAPPEAGIVFSGVTIPGQKERLAFVVLFDYGRELSVYSSSSPNTKGPFHGGIQSPEGQWAEIILGFTVDRMPIEGKYYVELDDSLAKVATETMLLAGKTYDVSAGRVFLVDLTSDSPSVRQVDVEMPPISSRLETNEDVFQAGDELREILGDRHPAIEEFLD